VTFAEMVYLMTRGELPHPGAAKLLEAALVAAVDHGPQAPSIAAARMAISCGIGINNAMASAINMLGDVHGGAGEQCVVLYNAIAERIGGDPASERRPPTRSPPDRRAGRTRYPARARLGTLHPRPARRCSNWWTPLPPPGSERAFRRHRPLGRGAAKAEKAGPSR
jgi:hypothetical protein